MTTKKVRHYIQRARTAKHYVIRAKRDGYPTIAADYARLEQECERLLDLLADWSSHFTGPKVIGGPLSSLRERTDAALLNGGRS